MAALLCAVAIPGMSAAASARDEPSAALQVLSQASSQFPSPAPSPVGAAVAVPDALPPVQRAGEIEYVSGGIGSDESAALESASRRWPLALQFAVRQGERAGFAADVAVTLRDTGARAVLELPSAGPWLLVRVPPGRYVVEATFGGQTQRRPVVVGAERGTRLVVSWGSSADLP